MARELIIHAPERPQQRIDLESTAYSLGRAHTNDLCFPEDASLSRAHLVLEAVGDGWRVRDLGSKNGTLVNGVHVSEDRNLRPGDRIQAGRLTLVYNDDDATGAESPVEFYVGPEADSSPSSGTLMTSLAGVLSGEVSLVSDSGQRKAGVAPAKQEEDTVVRALVKAGKELAGDRPLEELFQLILDLSIESVGAERGVLMTLEDETLVGKARVGEGFRISTAVRDHVINDKSSILVRDTQLDQAFKDRVSISEQQIRTMMAVPLQTDQRVIGLIYVDSRFFVRDFTPTDLNLLTVLSNIAAIRIENARLAEVERAERRMMAELDQAAMIQRRILPEVAPSIDEVELAGYNEPCHTVGGDYYDFIPGADGRVDVILGDVAGKGISASLLMTALQARVRLLAELRPGLAERIGHLDRSLSVDCPSNRFITLFYGVVEPAQARLRFCNAGHNPPLMLRNDGSTETLEGGGTVLGVFPALGYEAFEVPMKPGDLLVIFSDGVTEATNAEDEEFGEDRLAKALEGFRERSLDASLERVRRALDEWTAGAEAADDVTLVLARIPPA